jgi:hypothetical protein
MSGASFVWCGSGCRRGSTVGEPDVVGQNGWPSCQVTPSRTVTSQVDGSTSVTDSARRGAVVDVGDGPMSLSYTRSTRGRTAVGRDVQRRARVVGDAIVSEAAVTDASSVGAVRRRPCSRSCRRRHGGGRSAAGATPEAAARRGPASAPCRAGGPGVPPPSGMRQIVCWPAGRGARCSGRDPSPGARTGAADPAPCSDTRSPGSSDEPAAVRPRPHLLRRAEPQLALEDHACPRPRSVWTR